VSANTLLASALSPALGGGFAVLLDLTLKGTVVLAAALLCGVALRRASAATRHLSWSLALGGLLVLPLLALALPAWPVAVLPPAENSLNDPPDLETSTRTAAGDAVAPVTWPDPADAPPVRARPVSRSVSEPPPVPAPAESFTAGTHPASPTSPHWPNLVLLGWSAGVLLVLAPLALGLAGLVWLARRARPVGDPYWTTLVDVLAGALGIKRRVVLLRGAETTMPMTWGLWRPVLLLPADADGWPAERRRSVLLHELAHVKRFDCLTQLLARLACALYWFHPLAWLAARRLRLEREQACDDQVLCAGSRPSDYAQVLLDMARSLRSGRCAGFATVAMARRSQLGTRLRAVLDPGRPRHPVSRLRAALALAAAACLVVPLAALRPEARAAEEPARAGATALPEGRPQTTTADALQVSGQVVDAAGKPLAEVPVAVRAELKYQFRKDDKQAGEVKVVRTDVAGRFRLTMPATSSERFRSVRAFAYAPGQALTWLDLHPDVHRHDLIFRLSPERVVAGKLFNLQGQPAAGVTVKLARVAKSSREAVYETPDPGPAWPRAAVTDQEGRFTVRGLGPDVSARLDVSDDRFALQQIWVAPAGKEPARELTLALYPTQVFEGRVVYADTRRPVPHAPLAVQGWWRQSGEESALVSGQTDEDGRFSIKVFAGNRFSVRAYGPAGQPYMGVRQQLEWPKGAVRQRVELALPRGLMVRGKVVEQGTGKPVAAARVIYEDFRQNPNLSRDTLVGGPLWSVSGPDGVFQMAVPPGPGHLMARGPTPDYLHREFVPTLKGDSQQGLYLMAIMMAQHQWLHAGVDAAEEDALLDDISVMQHYPDGEAALDPAPGAGTVAVTVALRRGVTVPGRLTGPDGKPAPRARLLHQATLGYRRVNVDDGTFRLRGCEPGKSYQALVLDPQNKLGAAVAIPAQKGAEPVTVRLAPCGTATMRFVDPQGKPLVGYRPRLDVKVVPEGPAIFYGKDLAPSPPTNDQGYVTLPAVIPGAAYRVLVYKGSALQQLKPFTVAAGQSVDLGTMTVKKADD
jgi:beta-lactamase regulating signal transducer with metallopeptidase domain/5-hydroxyisourate hydrolase-like protein (transthyretin family)